MTETVQAIVPDISESVIVASIDSLDTQDQKDHVALVSSAPSEEDMPQESDQDDMIEETDFYICTISNSN